MSTNSYLDTYLGYVWQEGERVEMHQVLAVNHEDAYTRVLKDTALDHEDVEWVEINRYRAPSLVASPSDKLRKARRTRRTRAPQYYAKRRK